MILFWIVISAATLASFFFTAANYSFFVYSRTRLAELLGEGRRAKRIDRLERERDDLMLVTSLLRTAGNIAIFVTMLWYFREPEAERWWRGTLVALGYAAGVVAVFGVAVPLSWVRYSSESFLAHTLPLLFIVNRLLRPVIYLLHGLDPLVRRLLGIPERLEDDSKPAEQEILDAVIEGRKSGFVDDAQKRMFEAVVGFPATTVDQIMTPRTDIEGVSVTSTLREVREFISGAGHSRVPVYDGDLDHIVGVLYAKDLIPLLGTGKEEVERFDLHEVVRPALFVPETKTLNHLLAQLREMKVHIAMVLDEYGGTAGLVTIEDIVEEVFGEIRDEYEPAEEESPELQREGERSWVAAGRVHVGELNQALGCDLPDEEDYDTLAGFVLATLGRIPDTGESFRHDGLTFTILEAERTRVNRVRIEIEAEPSEAEGGS